MAKRDKGGASPETVGAPQAPAPGPERTEAASTPPEPEPVAAASPAPPVAPPGGGGKFRITAFGAVLKDGKFHSTGAVLELTAEEAKLFADRIEPV